MRSIAGLASVRVGYVLSAGVTRISPVQDWFKRVLGRRFCPWRFMLGSYAGVAQLAEQLICNQQVGGSTPFASSENMAGFPSGQREQTVNLSSNDFGGSNPPPSTIFDNWIAR